MSILEMQKALSVVLTDAASRDAYLSAPRTFLAAFGLSEPERIALEQLNVSRLEIYARMLMNSRVELGLRPLAHARALLPVDFYARFGPRYIRECPRTDDRDRTPLLREFKTMTAFLEQLIDEGAIEHPAFGDALRYDEARFTLVNDAATYAAIVDFERHLVPPDEHLPGARGRIVRSPGLLLREFRHAIDQLAATGDVTTLRPCAPLCLLFHKRAADRDVRIHRISPATRRFLQRCDGTRTLAELTGELAAGRQEVADACVGLGRQLITSGIIGVSRD